MLGLRPDGIVEVHYDDGAVDTEDSARDFIAKAREMLGDMAPAPVILAFGGLQNQTAEARKYYSESGDIQKVASRIAAITSLARLCVLGRFYAEVIPEQVPTKLFTDRKKALAWLKQNKKDK